MGRPDINNCDPDKLTGAKATCKAKEHKFIPSMSCLVDVCFGGDSFAEEDEDVWGGFAVRQGLRLRHACGQRPVQRRPSSKHPLLQSSMRCPGCLQEPHSG